MPPIPSNYGDRRDAASLGMIANTEPNTLISRTVETEGGIGFGVPVVQGVEDKGCDVGAGEVLGVTVQDRGVFEDKFDQLSSARIMTKGVIWVTASVEVAAGDAVYATAAGAWTNVATDNTLLANARFDTSAAADALVQLRLA